jgi:hypothetical protein
MLLVHEALLCMRQFEPSSSHAHLNAEVCLRGFGMRTADSASSVCKGRVEPTFPLFLCEEEDLVLRQVFFVFLSYFWETKKHFSPPSCVRRGGRGERGGRECCRNVEMWGGLGEEARCRWC